MMTTTMMMICMKNKLMIILSKKMKKNQLPLHLYMILRKFKKNFCSNKLKIMNKTIHIYQLNYPNNQKFLLLVKVHLGECIIVLVRKIACFMQLNNLKNLKSIIIRLKNYNIKKSLVYWEKKNLVK